MGGDKRLAPTSCGNVEPGLRVSRRIRFQHPALRDPAPLSCPFVRRTCKAESPCSLRMQSAVGCGDDMTPRPCACRAVPPVSSSCFRPLFVWPAVKQYRKLPACQHLRVVGILATRTVGWGSKLTLIREILSSRLRARKHVFPVKEIGPQLIISNAHHSTSPFHVTAQVLHHRVLTAPRVSRLFF